MTGGIITYDVSALDGAFANMFLILLNALFFNVKFVGHVSQYPEDKSNNLLNDRDSNVFDFVIVGSGAAGCVLANRLSEQDQWSVLLVEAGDYPPVTATVPALFPTFFDSDVNTWRYKFQPDKSVCLGYRDKQCQMTRGKVVGGTNAINNMHYIRGIDEFNSTNLIYESFESYPQEERVPTNFLCEGELKLETAVVNNTFRMALKNAYHSLGIGDRGGKNTLGYTSAYLMMQDGERYDIGKAFLTPIRSRSNFFLSKNTMVEGIVLNNPRDKRAKGINATIKGHKVFIEARKEVIVTAGAINNAKLFLLSGIGPKEYLQQKKIPMALNMPAVGQNLRFHMGVPLFLSFNASVLYEEYTEADMIYDTFDYIMYRRGNLSNIGLHEFVALMTTEQHPSDPNIAIYHNYFKAGDRMLKAWLDGFSFHPKIHEKILKTNEKQVLVMFIIVLLSPKSSGVIKLNETYFEGYPFIEGKMLSDPDGQDILALTNAFSRITSLQGTPFFEELQAEFIDINVPNCRNYKFCSLHYVVCYIRNMVFPTSNVAGTLRRGPECDNQAVVKDDFEVRHIRCLRVCDASILPDPGLGNTVGAEAMMGVKLSELLKEKWVKDYVSPLLAQ